MTNRTNKKGDQELLRYAQIGDVEAFSELVRRHEGAVYRLIRSQIGDEAEARDLTQDCFVSAFMALNRYDAVHSLRGWLSRIAINKARDWRRRQRVRQFFRFAVPLSSPEALQVQESTVPVDVELAEREALKETWALIADLPPSLSQALILCTIDGHTQSEAGAIMGITAKAVEMRIRKARFILLKRTSTET